MEIFHRIIRHNVHQDIKSRLPHVGFAAEQALLPAFRESLQKNFGDYALGSALASFQGEQMCKPCDIFAC
jgi:hypothetical protein